MSSKSQCAQGSSCSSGSTDLLSLHGVGGSLAHLSPCSHPKVTRTATALSPWTRVHPVFKPNLRGCEEIKFPYASNKNKLKQNFEDTYYICSS